MILLVKRVFFQVLIFLSSISSSLCGDDEESAEWGTEGNATMGNFEESEGEVRFLSSDVLFCGMDKAVDSFARG